MVFTALCFALLLLTARGTHAGTVTGRTVSFSDGMLVAAAKAVFPIGEAPIGAVDDPADNFTDAAASLLLTNSSAASWAVRAGASGADTVPNAVVAHDGAVFLLAAAKQPMLYKYESKNDTASRVFQIDLGSPGDSFSLMTVVPGVPGASGGCAHLLIAGTLLPGSKLQPSGADSRRVGLVTVDTCTGDVVGTPIVFGSEEVTAGQPQLEILQSVSVLDGVAFVGTQLVRVRIVGDQRLNIANPVMHRVELGGGAVATANLPVIDCAALRVHVGKYVHVAIDRHPSIGGATSGKDAIQIFRLDKATLKSVTWGPDAKIVDVMLPFRAELPLRETDRWTRVIEIGFLPKTDSLVLLVQTTETTETWDEIKDTAPIMDFNLATKVRNMMDSLLGEEGEEGPAFEAGTLESLALSFASVHQSVPVSLSARPLLLLVDDSAKISSRMDDLLDDSITSPVLPRAPLPEARANVSLGLSEMAIDEKMELAYVIGSVISPGSDEALLYMNVSLAGPIAAGESSASPTPIGNGTRKECVGASTRTFEGRSVAALIALHPQLRLQKHVRLMIQCVIGWMRSKVDSTYDGIHEGCEKPAQTDMLCYQWAPPGKTINEKTIPHEKGRLCATPNHVIQHDGKLKYMKEFCKYPESTKCTAEKDTPINFKGECGEHIVIAPDIQITQHVGDIATETAKEAADRECTAISSNRMLWRVGSL